MRNLWGSFNFLVHFLIIFFIVQSLKNEILSKILDIEKYNIVRHWFYTKNWIFAISFKKVSIDGFLHYLWGLLFFLMSKVSNINFYEKSLIYNYTTLYDINFPQKIGFLRFFLRKFLLTVFSHYLWGLLFFLMSKVSNMNFYEKSLIYNYTTLYDIDFPQKIGFLRFFLRKFLLTVFHIIYGELLFFLMSKVSNMNFYEKSLIYNYTTLYDIDFPQKIGFLRFFLRKFLLTVFHIIYGDY